ncbi:DNA invertase Pin-like site-specific DNA recombinase [Bradyrhizobium ottawaense]|uniref:DNA invertase Pin-like site-specific DNA recombinase n=1 Tax=Bradyrhizobium ottawaense TaxID=931866 RepID=A0ABV4FJE7_9BRAD
MLTMLSAFAQLDRAFILSRTKEGRERAKAQGRRFGPEPKLSRSRSRMRGICKAKGGPAEDWRASRMQCSHRVTGLT